MRRVLLIGLWIVSGACTASPPLSPPSALPVISLEKPVHFAGPDGSDVLASPGLYMVRQGGDAQLSLIPTEGHPLAIQATAIRHDDDLPAQVLSVAGDEETHHVVLFLPERKALEAVGSYTGVRPRAFLLDAPKSWCLRIPELPCIVSVSPNSITWDTVVTVSGQNLARVRPESEAAPTNTSWAAFVKVSDSAGFYGEKVFLEVRDWFNSSDGRTIRFRIGGPVWWHPGTFAYQSIFYDEALARPGDRFKPLSPAPTTWTGKLRFRNPSVGNTPMDNYYSLASPQTITWTRSGP